MCGWRVGIRLGRACSKVASSRGQVDRLFLPQDTFSRTAFTRSEVVFPVVFPAERSRGAVIFLARALNHTQNPQPARWGRRSAAAKGCAGVSFLFWKDESAGANEAGHEQIEKIVALLASLLSWPSTATLMHFARPSLAHPLYLRVCSKSMAALRRALAVVSGLARSQQSPLHPRLGAYCHQKPGERTGPRGTAPRAQPGETNVRYCGSIAPA